MPRELQLVQLLERRTWRQQTGGGAGHHAVMVVFVAALHIRWRGRRPQVNAHAVARREQTVGPFAASMSPPPPTRPRLTNLPLPSPSPCGTLYLMGALERQICSCSHQRHLSLGTPHNFWVCWYCGRVEGAPPTPKPALAPPCDPGQQLPDDRRQGGQYPGPPGSRRRRDPGEG